MLAMPVLDAETGNRARNLRSLLAARHSGWITAFALELLPMAGGHAVQLLRRRPDHEDGLHPPLRPVVLSSNRRAAEAAHYLPFPRIIAVRGDLIWSHMFSSFSSSREHHPKAHGAVYPNANPVAYSVTPNHAVPG